MQREREDDLSMAVLRLSGSTAAPENWCSHNRAAERSTMEFSELGSPVPEAFQNFDKINPQMEFASLTTIFLIKYFSFFFPKDKPGPREGTVRFLKQDISDSKNLL